MQIDDLIDDALPNKLIPRTFRERLPVETEIQEARKSLAFWWYRCLSLSTSYLQCCADEGQGRHASLYADMGDVRLPFGKWWLRHGRKAFTEQKSFDEVVELETYKQADAHIDRADALVLSIPLSLRKATAMRKIGKILAAAYAKRPSVDIWAASTARRMIVKNKVRKATIQQLVKLWELRLQYPDDTLNELGERAGIVLDLMARNTEAVIEPSQSDERRRLTIAVSRLLKQARHLIDNAADGVFPSLKAPVKTKLS